MSTPELLHRIKEKCLIYLQRFGFFSAKLMPAPDISVEVAPWLKYGTGLSATCYVEEATRVLAGEVPIFALSPASLGAIPLWNTDPKSGTHAPLSFGRSLDYRNAEVVGDIKYLWEPNRHLQWVVLAQAYALSRERRFLDGFAQQLSSWLEQCPYPLGPNWTSSLELGIRLINWSIVWQLIGGQRSELFEGIQGQELRQRWLCSIYQHCHSINLYWSRYSSANNHLIGEAAGLYIASVTWPFWYQCKRWGDVSYKILLDEALKQNTEDGVNREQAVSYQQFVLDFLLFSGLAARAASRDFPAAYWERLDQMIGFLASIMDVQGNVPMIGDADDGYVTRLCPSKEFCPYKSLLATGGRLFGRPEYLRKAGAIDDKTLWLMGLDDCRHDVTMAVKGEVSRRYAIGGYYILGSDFDTDREVKCVVDAGPLGYLGIAAHGHADALSVVLSVGGREILVDPGTYAYHTQKVWRDYFRGTSAHNTVRIDSMDQSESGGNFMWIHKAEAECEVWQSDGGSQRLVASHNGYCRLADPVTHRREIEYSADLRRFRITDQIECTGQHLVERIWHFAEDCEITVDHDTLFVACERRNLRFSFNPVLHRKLSVTCGAEKPILGWISRAYDVRAPITTAVESLKISGSTTLIVEIIL
ncbi:MAG: alginate lyase family protein [Halioglobus sp.]|nr:alginate lyase family protein [Halioglobus sp.]